MAPKESDLIPLSPEELDRQYNARAAIPEHPQIFARWAAQSAAARTCLGWEADCRFGPAPEETLDLFPARNAGAPLLVFIHGGWWRSLDKSDFSFLAPAFVDAGISFAAVNYTLAPRASIEEIVRQMLRACAWCWRNAAAFGADPGRICVAGHSAGAHLGAMMLAADWPAYAPDLPPELLRGGLAISGLYDLEPVARTPFLKSDLRLDAARARRVSPVRYRPARPVPLHTAVGERESGEFHRQTQLVREAWRHCRGEHLTLTGRNHLTVLDPLADPRSALSGVARRMMVPPQ